MALVADGTEGRLFPASNQSDVLMEPWSLPLPRVVTVAGLTSSN